jgi:hypothetical protein
MFVKTGKKIPAFGPFPETELVLRDYMDGRMALTGHAQDEEWFVATVNIDHFQSGHSRGFNEVWLKGWSENAGVPEALEKAGVLRLTDTHAEVGMTKAQLAVVADDVVALYTVAHQEEMAQRLAHVEEEEDEDDQEQGQSQGPF